MKVDTQETDVARALPAMDRLRDDTPVRPVRAAVLFNHPAQHFSEGFRLLDGHPELRTRVYYWNAATEGLYDPGFDRHVRWNVDLHSGYDWWAPPAHDPIGRRRLAVLRQLRQDRPDVLLSFGWGSPIARLGIVYATATATPILYYGDTNWRSPLTGRHPRLRRRILRTLFRTGAGALATGTFNRDFYIIHGLAPELIHPGVYPMDAPLFSAAAEVRDRRESAEAADRGLVIGFVGKFLPIKGVEDLIEAAARLPRDSRWELRLIGDGPIRAQLESLVTERGLTDRVHFLGFRNTDEVPALVGAMDIMVMPSRVEPRGLVAIEAMAAGAATIVSSATGVWGPGDVLEDDESGLVYPVGDVDALAGCLRRLLDDPDLRSRLAARGRVRARSSGPHDFAATAAAALVVTGRRQR